MNTAKERVRHARHVSERTRAGRMVKVPEFARNAGNHGNYALFLAAASLASRFIEAEEFAAKGAAVIGPLGSPVIRRRMAGARVRVSNRVVHISVKTRASRTIWSLGEPNSYWAVMADEKMLDDGLQFVAGSLHNGVHGFLKQFRVPHMWPRSWPSTGSRCAFVAEFRRAAERPCSIAACEAMNRRPSSD